MDASSGRAPGLAATARRLVRRLLTIGENRLELLAVEVQEERGRLLHAIVLALAASVLGLLAAMTLTAAIVVALWARSPLAALLALTGLYGAAALWAGFRLRGLLRDHRVLPATLDQLQKDRACLEDFLS